MVWMKGSNPAKLDTLERIARSLEAIESVLAVRALSPEDHSSASDDLSDDGSDWDCHDTGPYALA